MGTSHKDRYRNHRGRLAVLLLLATYCGLATCVFRFRQVVARARGELRASERAASPMYEFRDLLDAADNLAALLAARPKAVPAMVALGLYLAYPVFATLWLSLTRDGDFVGLSNYSSMMSEAKFWESMRNNMLWLIVVPALSTAFGLLAAQLSDRIRWGNIAKSLIFMPMAISFVGASVIWKLIYDTRPEGQAHVRDQRCKQCQ